MKSRSTIQRVKRELYKLSKASDEPLRTYAYAAAMALQWASEDVRWATLPKEIQRLGEPCASSAGICYTMPRARQEGQSGG
jgi:hypothetical protein